MSSAPSTLPQCNGGVPVSTTSGFSVCVGTAGGGVTTSSTVNNKETPESLEYLGFYNTAGENACISQGVPGPNDTTASTSATWNKVGYVTGMGCCAPTSAFAKPLATNAGQATRLEAFDSDTAGVMPPDLMGLTKVWGVSPTSWMHGGVHASNVGTWIRDLDNKPFTVTTPGGQSWTQDHMMWCRLTGDDYQADLDPYGVTNPAQPGSYITACKTPSQKACDGCAAGQIYAVSGKTNGCTASGTCANPFTHSCNQGVLTADIMASPGTATACASAVAGFAKTTAACGDSDGGTTSPTKVSNTYATTTHPYTGKVNGYSNPLGRVGGCFVSRDMYGPGVFSVLINLPPTAPQAGSPLVQSEYPAVNPRTGAYGHGSDPEAVPGGRGYVFAMWTFSYTEAYGPPATSPGVSAFNAGTGSIPGSIPKPAQVESVSGPVTVTKPVTADAGFGFGDPDDGFTYIHNHEIDIEVPANTAQFQGANMTSVLGLNTANFNTWQSDTGNYDAPGADASSTNPTFYQQVQANAPSGQFFASVGQSDTDTTFHELSFVWYVDPDPTTPTNSYVAFLRDGVEIFRTYRFVPRRSGRVVIGLWPAWWGSNYTPLSFNHVYAKIARLRFLPQASDLQGTRFTSGALVTAATQMYDTALPMLGLFSKSATVSCGFTALPGSGAGSSSLSCFMKRHSPQWLLWFGIALIVVACAMWIWAGTTKRRG